MKLSVILWGIPQAMRVCALMYPKFKERLKERDVIAQFAVKAEPTRGRWIQLKDGRITTGSGIHANPTFTIRFKDAKIAGDFLTPPFNQLERIHAAKNFQITMDGPDTDIVWFMHLVASMESYTWAIGTDMGNGVTRYTNGTNGGPIFVYVKDGKILRTTPMELGDDDPGSYTIEARGKTFTPPRKTTLAAHGACQKSMVYSKNRILKPMKRVDFDHKGERNIQNRGKSEFVEIEWEEAIEIVSSEIKRCKKVGPGAIAVANGSHHQWGNLGHYLSAFNRFWNLIGVTKLMHTPDSWEGWFWGAQHHWGNSMRLGAAEPYGTVEDCLQNADMMVFWSSDPDASYGFEGTQRRKWAKELGIKMVHIDPYLNHTAAHLGGKWISPKSGTDTAFAQALTYVWITEDTYDKEFVEKRTTGFGEYKAHILGEDDGIPKTPEWQETETGIPARDCRALAREWAKKNTYLGVGGWGCGLGGACRGATGSQWARQMTILAAMQGMGKPGSNLGNLQFGAPVDMNFYFPGYAEGSMSGDLAYSAQSTNNYQRMPHIVTMSSVKQVIPRMWLPEAIMGKPKLGYVTAVDSVVGQFFPIGYPSPGHVPVEMIYKYGSSSLGTQVDSNRWINMYQHDNLKFVVNQSVWMEGETKFADVILPACTVFERWDLGEWYNVGPGYVHHMYSMNNHRVVSLQHKCIEPLGESKSDYDIFLSIAEQMDLGAVYSEGGNSELEWAKRAYESSDCARDMSWRQFLKKGYYVVPPEPKESRAALGLNWFYEGRKKDVPEPYPLPSDYVDKYAEGLQTTSGKYEFVPTTLKRFDDPERPPVNKYMKTFETAENAPEVAAKYPLRLLTPHTRYAFHLMGDDEGCFVRDIREHRVKVGEHYYLTCRISREDAEARDIQDDDLIRLFNDRGSVVCAAQVTDRLRPGIVSAPTASAEYRPAGEPGKSTDLGGCVNVLNSSKPITTKAHGIRPNGTLLEVEKWTGVDTWKPVEPKQEVA